MIEPNRGKPEESQALDEMQRVLTALEPLAIHVDLVRKALVENRGDTRPKWVYPGNEGSTYLEIARQFVDAHRRCPYWQLWEGSLSAETVRWRANFRLMFMEGRKAAKLDGEKGWMRILEMMPTPHDAELTSKAQGLMTQVVARTMRPLDAAIELTTDFLRIRRGLSLKRDFVRQGADLNLSPAENAEGAATPDPHFKQDIEMIKATLAREAGRTPPEQKPDMKSLPGTLEKRPRAGYGQLFQAKPLPPR
jgi:hypothetical protein